MKRDAKFARQAAETYAQIFGPDRFFIEFGGLFFRNLGQSSRFDPFANSLNLGIRQRELECGGGHGPSRHFLVKDALIRRSFDDHRSIVTAPQDGGRCA